jgi:hypothetical protein
MGKALAAVMLPCDARLAMMIMVKVTQAWERQHPGQTMTMAHVETRDNELGRALVIWDEPIAGASPPTSPGAPGRFDVAGFPAAVDRARVVRGLRWKDVAEQAGVSASTLTRLTQGHKPDVDSFAKLTAWAGLSADEFVVRGAPSPSS